MIDSPDIGSEDIAAVEAIYAAMASADLSTLFDLLDPNIVVVQDDRLPWGGRHVGHDGFATFGLALRTHIESSITTDAIFSADRDVVQMGHTRGRIVATGIPFDIPEVHRWTIRHGRAVAAHFSIDTAAMLGLWQRADQHDRFDRAPTEMSPTAGGRGGPIHHAVGTEHGVIVSVGDELTEVAFRNTSVPDCG